MINGSLGRCRPSEMGTKDTKAASIQIEPIVATATYRVTQRVYLRKRRLSRKKKNKRVCIRYNVNSGSERDGMRVNGRYFHARLSTAGCAKKKGGWIHSVCVCFFTRKLDIRCSNVPSHVSRRQLFKQTCSARWLKIEDLWVSDFESGGSKGMSGWARLLCDLPLEAASFEKWKSKTCLAFSQGNGSDARWPGNTQHAKRVWSRGTDRSGGLGYKSLYYLSMILTLGDPWCEYTDREI